HSLPIWGALNVTSSRYWAVGPWVLSRAKMSKPSCMMSRPVKPLAGPKQSPGDLLAFAEAGALRPAPSGYWAQFLLMPFGTECGLITRCMGLRALQMASVSDGSVTMSTKPSVTHCVNQILTIFGQRQSQLLASSL